MNNIQEKLEEYIQCLNLPGDKDILILEALELLRTLNTDEISMNSNYVAKLFCETICHSSEVIINEKITADLVWESYKNIMDLECERDKIPSVEIIIIHFLKKLNNMSGMTGGESASIIDDEMQSQFKVLCSKLEEMKIIFRLKKDEIELFPIGKLLAVVIGRDYTFERLDEVTLNTFLLALEIFDTDLYVTERNKLDEIIKKCNLQCLRYLSNSSIIRIGGDVWKNNFKYNGVLILADIFQGKIYIRHPEKIYFKHYESDVVEGLKSEKNTTGREIAYYYEYDYATNGKFVSIDEIMLNGNCHLKTALIRHIYNNRLYNCIYKNAFLKIGDNLKIVNPFTREDKTLIFDNGRTMEANVVNVTDYAMKPFSLIKMYGKELDYIIIGSICKLLTICNVGIDDIMNELESNSDHYQDIMIQIWLKKSENIYENMLLLQETYFRDICYIKKRKEIANKKIIDISWIPIMLPIQILQDKVVELCGENLEGDIKYILLEVEEDFEGNKSYKNIETDSEILFESLVICEDDILEQEKFYSVYCQNKYYVSREIDNYIRLINKINDTNKELHKLDDFLICSEMQLQVVLEAMKLQEKALQDVSDCFVDFDSISRLRIIHHVICNMILRNNQWKNFIEIINKHQILGYEFLKTQNLFEDNVLVVPKERQESDSAMNSIINSYLKRKSVRNHDYYHSEIGFEQDEYTYRGQKINKIIFLFDTLQSGTSTIRNLKFYFENYDKPIFENVQNQHMRYTCNGNEIKLEIIIEKNHPMVEVVVLYGSKEGKRKVEEYLISNPFIDNKTVTCIREINRVADIEFINKVHMVYKPSLITIEENQFPIIREFNQPKKNAFPQDNLTSENIASIFVKKKEFKNVISQR